MMSAMSSAVAFLFTFWLLPLVAGQTAAGSEPKCALTGHVVNSLTGAPVNKAEIHLLLSRLSHPAEAGDDHSSPQSSYLAVSGIDGSFHYEGFPAGDYHLSGVRLGFIKTQYGANGSSSQAGTMFTFNPGQEITGITLSLIPQGTISGRLLDEDGDTVGNASVQIAKATWVHGRREYATVGGATVNDLGEFRVANLATGTYYLFAQPSVVSYEGVAVPGNHESRQVRTFYPAAINRESANLIDLKAGEELSGMDIHVRRLQTFRVHGRIVGSLAPGTNTGNLMVSLTPRESGIVTGLRSSIDRGSTFNISGVAPGSYSVSLTSGGGSHLLARQQLDVGSSDATDIVITVAPALTLRGRIHVNATSGVGNGPPSLERIHIALVGAEPGISDALNAAGQTNGTFAIENVLPARYYLHIDGNPDGTYLKSLRIGQQEIMGRDLDLSQGPTADLEIEFRYGAAEVSGSIEADQARAATAPTIMANENLSSHHSASVFLVPNLLNADGSGLLHANINQNGTFTLKNIAPGHYRLYALENVTSEEFQNPDLLMALDSKKTDVDLKDGDTKQFRLEVIPFDEIGKILNRLGLSSQ
jgi:hypothetical protein